MRNFLKNPNTQHNSKRSWYISRNNLSLILKIQKGYKCETAFSGKVAF